MNHKFLACLIICLLLFISGCAIPATATLPPVSSTATAAPSNTTAPSATLAPTPTHTPNPTPTTIPPAQPGQASIGDAYAPQLGNTGYDVVSYDLFLKLDPASVEITGSAQLTLQPTVPNLGEFSLDFGEYQITSVSIDEQPAGYRYESEKLYIQPVSDLLLDQPFVITIDYTGPNYQDPSPYVPFISHSGLFFPGGMIFSLSEPDGAHHWFPCNNHPRDKATFRIALQVPQGFIGVSNGTLVDQTEIDGQPVFHWQHDYPMAPYLAVAAVGRFEPVITQSPAGVPIRHYVLPETRAAFDLAAGVTGEALDWIADLYGPYPFEAFGFVTTRLVTFASETQTMVILPEGMLNEETVIHEIAHMWFGNWVSLDSWQDMWLKEGLAIYTYLLWQTRDNPETLFPYMENQLIPTVQSKSTDFTLNALPPNYLLQYDSYWRGTVTIHRLRLAVGDEVFFSGLRQVVVQYGGKHLTAEEFISVFENLSNKELSAELAAWMLP